MQTAKSTLKLKVPVSVVTPILKKQVVVFDKQVLQNKPVNTKLTLAVNPHSNKSNKVKMANLLKNKLKQKKPRL